MSETNESVSASASNDEVVAQPAVIADPATGTDQTSEADTTTAEPTEPEPVKPVKPHPAEKRIEQLLRREREAREEANQAKALLAQYQQGTATPKPATPDGFVPASEFDRRVAEYVAADNFSKTCNSIAEVAMVNHGDKFDTAKDQLAMYAEPEQVTSLLEAITGLELPAAEAADLYVRIGNDPAEITRLVSLSDARRALEIAKLGMAKPAAPAVSKASAPIKPIVAKTIAELDPSKLTGREFTSWLADQEKRYKG